MATLEKKVMISSIEPNESGDIGVRFTLVTKLDGREVERLNHRTMLAPGVKPEDQLALVNDHLGREPGLGGIPSGPWPPVSANDLALLKANAKLLHTPEVIKAKEAREAQAKKDLEAGKIKI